MKNTKRIIEIYIWDDTTKTVRFLDHFYSNMDEAVKKLPKGQFVRCERSHIVNLDYVCRMTREFFNLMDENATRIPIGRVHKDKVKAAYFKRRGDQYS